MTLGRAIMLSMWVLFLLPMTVTAMVLILHPEGSFYFRTSSISGFLPSVAVEVLLFFLGANAFFLMGYKLVGKYEDRKKAAAEKEIAATKTTQGGK